MSDRDKSSERFLERWSRKKVEAERQSPDAATKAPTATPTDAAHSNVQPQNSGHAPATTAAPPRLDLADLPSLESITASTDIRAFLAPGVPKELAHAALRRAWSADPAIRDFVGLAENAWDFTAEGAIEGFGALPPDYDIKRLVAQVFGEVEKQAAPRTAANKTTSVSSGNKTTSPKGQIASRADVAPLPENEPNSNSPVLVNDENATIDKTNADVVQRSGDGALHNSNSSNDTEERKKPRQRGRALPK